jgi:excisionase family DNA binding protein
VVDPLTKGINTMRSARRHHPDPQLLSIEKAGEFLDVSASTVRRLVKTGQLKAHKIGGQIRISMADLLAFIDHSRV